MAGQREPAGALVVSDDVRIIDAVVELAARCSVPCHVAAAPPAQVWQAARVVVVGVDRASAVIRTGLPRRHAVCLAADGQVTPQLGVVARAVGADHLVVLPDGTAQLSHLLAQARPAAALPGQDVPRALATSGGGCRLRREPLR